MLRRQKNHNQYEKLLVDSNADILSHLSIKIDVLFSKNAYQQALWARAHQDWLLPQWRNVLFSDESWFGLVRDDYRERLWRERGGQNRLATAIGVAPYRGGTQMFGLMSDDYRERVWRERGGQNRLATATGVAPYRGGRQMF
nr:unnamed protein product [Callosobruchus chinensis]